MVDKRHTDLELGRRYFFPENLHIEYDGLSGSVSNEIVAKMADKYDNFIADQIAMEARAEGITDLTVINKSVVINALKKAIPQPIILEACRCLCPGCRYDLMGLWDFDDIQDPSYCPQCGQRIIVS